MVELLPSILMMLVGIAALLFGGDILVRGATACARYLGVPPLLVGLTLVAFGTSAPEMVVGATAAIQNAPGLALGNIVGSNIANVLLVLGLPALFTPVVSDIRGVRRNTAIALTMTVGFVGLSLDGDLNFIDSMALAGGIIAYIGYLALSARSARDDPQIAELTDIEGMEGLPGSAPMTGLFLLGGLVILPVGARLIVDGGVGIARVFEIPEAVIGLTLLAFGTSLPELATTVIASLRRQTEMALGNIVGSNIFNICAVGAITGISAQWANGAHATVNPEFLRLDFQVMIGAMLAVVLFAFSRKPIGRRAGAIFTLSYIAYIIVLMMMNPLTLPGV